MKKDMKKNAQKCARKANANIAKDLHNEIKAFNRAHKRLVNKLIATSDDPTFVIATMHTVHTVSMKYEQDTMCTLLSTRKAQKGE